MSDAATPEAVDSCFRRNDKKNLIIEFKEILSNMRIAKKGKQKQIIIDPGEHYVSNEAVTLSTLLGSCVAACLYDPVRCVIGMNHFLLTTRGYDENVPICDTEPGKYGVCAMELLIDNMLNMGAQRENLRAKAFGGGSMFKPFEECSISNFCLGNINGIFIREFLKKSNIKLISEDLGGDRGRIIHFSSDDFAVYVKKIKTIANSGLVQRDRILWKQTTGQ
ncbi:chemotaxis protein CheD [Desulfonema magnum]|uniref:chemotaxis protein CheD n=1 Tax=Desulfonema magnum TaxID=45655 RepID=UPI001A9B83FD|nr:chemotaxis protein CheD [Desulfonema magnum]